MSYTPASFLGRWLAPVLQPLHHWSFFEAWIYIPVMTGAALLLFYCLLPKLENRDELRGCSRRRSWLFLDAAAAWLACQAFAVALKTSIVEELDYGYRVWFEPWIGPGHLFISLAAVLYLSLMVTENRSLIDFAHGFVTLALVLGYLTGLFRIITESWPGNLGGGGLILFFVCWHLAIRRRLAFLERPSRKLTPGYT